MFRNLHWIVIIWFIGSSFNLPEENKYLAQKVADVEIFDAQGKYAPLSSYIQGKPLIIVPVYTKCASLCGLINHGVYKAVKDLGTLGQDFNMLSFSFDSSDQFHDLKFYEELWKMDGKHWQTTSASYENIQKLLQSIGYEYDYLPQTKEFNHPAILVVISPNGKISRFIYGLNPSKKDIELAVMEAMAEKSRPGLFKGFYLRCFGYDPLLKTYKVDWRFIISTTAGLLMISLISIIFIRSFIVSKPSHE